MPIYDKEKTDEDQLRDITGINKADEKAMEARAYDNDGLDADEAVAADGPAASKADSKELSALGKSPAGDLFNANKDAPSGGVKGLANRLIGTRRRKAATGGGILTGLIVALVLAIMSLLPMKVLHIVNNLQQHFFASSEEATEKITDRLFTSYIVKKVIPGMHDNLCTTTRASKSCVDTGGRNNLISVLYGGWRDANLEGKLAENYGLEIRREGNKFYLRSDRLANDVDLGDYDRGNTTDFDKKAFAELSKREVRQEIKRSLAGETRWKRVMYRYKVGTLLERKYGIVRCVIGCDYRDRLQERREDRKLRFKSLFIQRVVGPRNEAYALIMECAMSGFNCADPKESNDKGERNTTYEEKLNKRLLEYRKNNLESSESRQRSLAAIEAEAQSIREKGVMGNMVEKFVKSSSGKIAVKGIPLIGWIDLGARLTNGVQNAGPAIRHLTYVTNSVAMVETYMMYRSNGDELKRGTILAEDLGEMAESLSPTDGTERKDQGGVGAEASPLYGALLGNNKTSLAFSPLGNKVSAATNGSGYTCEDDNNKPVPEGELVCNVERLDTVSKVGGAADLASSLANSPMFKLQGMAADFWLATGGKVIDLIGEAAGVILVGIYNTVVPDAVKDKVEEIGKAIVTAMMGYVIKEPLTDSMSGARNFNLTAGGADVAGNDFARYGLGGAKLTDQQITTIREQRKQEAQQEFKNMPLLARIFDTENPQSGISQLAMSLPSTSANASLSSFANSIGNPFGLFAKSFSSVQAGGYAQAATLEKDPFGVDQYGYPDDDPVFDVEDYEKYYDDKGCGDTDNVKKWGDKATQMNEDTQMTIQNETNPCMLLAAGAGSAGALYTDEVLTPEELGNTQNSSGGYSAMTFNVLGADKDGLSWNIRKTHVANLIKEKGPDVIGFQEVNEDYQQKDLRSALPGYDSWDGGEDGENTKRPIYWKSSDYEKADGGIYKYQRYSDSEKQPAPWVRLKNKGNNSDLYVFNYHGIAHDENADKKVEGAKDLVKAIDDIAGGSAPVVLVGDFNSDYGKFAHPIILAAGFVDAFQVAETKVGSDYETHHDDPPAPRTKGTKHIDHIFIRPSMPVPLWENIINDDSTRASDHSPVFAIIGAKTQSTEQVNQPVNDSPGKINLSNWKITLPTGKEIKQPQLASYNDKWYHPAADGSGQEFYVDSGDKDIGTTKNSSNPRSELREMTSGGKSNASWSSTSGTHRMIIRQKVTELSGRRHVVIGQIHDAEDDVTVFRLEGDKLWITDGDGTHGHPLGTVKLGQVITVGFDVSGGVVRYYFSPGGATNPPTISYTQRKKFSGAYFKAGNYYQGKTDGGKSRVVIMGLSVTHDNSVPSIASLDNDIRPGVLPPTFALLSSIPVKRVPEIST